MLGSGSAWPIPRLGCDCEQCRSPDPRDRAPARHRSCSTAGCWSTPARTPTPSSAAGAVPEARCCSRTRHHDHVLGLHALAKLRPDAAALHQGVRGGVRGSSRGSTSGSCSDAGRADRARRRSARAGIRRRPQRPHPHCRLPLTPVRAAIARLRARSRRPPGSKLARERRSAHAGRRDPRPDGARTTCR